MQAAAPVLPRPSPSPSPHRWKVLAAGVAANASFSAVFSGIPVTSVVLRSDYRLSNTQLGLALGLLSLGVALGELPWGVLTDRWGDRKVLLAGLLGASAALGLLMLYALPGQGAASFAWLCAGLMLAGLLGGSVNGASGRAIMGWFGEGERGLAMSIRQTAVPLGGGLGALLLPTLAAQAGFGAVFAALMAACLASVGLVLRWLREAPVAPAHGAAPVVGAASMALRSKLVWRLALGIGLLCAPQVALLSFGGIFLQESAQASVLAISVLLTLVQLGAAAARIASGRWTDRRGQRRDYLRGCALASAALFGLLGVLAPLLVAAGVVVSAWHGVAYTELAVVAGAGQVGTALGLGNSCVFLVFFLAAQAIPPLLHWQGWPAVWLAIAVVALLVWPLFPPEDRARH
ncbi:MFS transporter [Herbaspirillum seropedicae]|uniref:Permease of the major facilitator superfamily protein n=1 Tax=Herbaspirillum seropedicae (strain SmR1) TaxID=757424 RepID=D8IRD8_HERSS|nr:MFS transporter [Herbaspirillum seropedicae]ADJ65264.1 permease of the major facilitator superfamily protein [Herbaspirillum seropedicae SmR1]AKN67116.1 MFS transporter [Herbaspirillum seropedicae]NQE30283.1 MFS transporter [Herbaspirillum seropedicae]UMU23121.1 MFS transporter [Herbaspirillum seropedicae]